MAKRSTDLTKVLFQKIVRRELGDKEGRIELRETGGILIHPGESTPTLAVFRLGAEYKVLRLSLSMAPLGASGNAIPEAGTVNVEILLDGKSVFKGPIDRHTSSDRTLDVSKALELAIRVDNANGKAWFDWFFVSFESAA